MSMQPSEKARRRWVPIWATIAILGAVLTPGLTGSAAAQTSPCNGGRGTCTTANFVDVLDFSGLAICTWTINYDWGDGTSDTFTRTVTPPDSLSFEHRYAQPGIYTLRLTGSGVSTGRNTCTFGAATSFVEVAPAGARVCQGRIATIVGTNGADRLTGTAGADVIVGLGGNDIINGGAGNDRICAGRGADTVTGGPGIDGIEGGKGRDTLRGGPGRDFIDGGSGRDRIFGGGGNDSLWGRSGNDRLVGGKGRDTLRGGSGNDRLRGNKGRDTLIGGRGSDSCRGGPARDTQRSCER